VNCQLRSAGGFNALQLICRIAMPYAYRTLCYSDRLPTPTPAATGLPHLQHALFSNAWLPPPHARYRPLTPNCLNTSHRPAFFTVWRHPRLVSPFFVYGGAAPHLTFGFFTYRLPLRTITLLQAGERKKISERTNAVPAAMDIAYGDCFKLQRRVVRKVGATNHASFSRHRLAAWWRGVQRYRHLSTHSSTTNMPCATDLPTPTAVSFSLCRFCRLPAFHLTAPPHPRASLHRQMRAEHALFRRDLV